MYTWQNPLSVATQAYTTANAAVCQIGVQTYDSLPEEIHTCDLASAQLMADTYNKRTAHCCLGGYNSTFAEWFNEIVLGNPFQHEWVEPLPPLPETIEIEDTPF